MNQKYQKTLRESTLSLLSNIAQKSVSTGNRKRLVIETN